MLYYLFEYLESEFQLTGASVFGFISFRAAMAILMSLAISTIYGKRIINYLLAKQVGESVRDLGLQGQSEKAGTPTMGGFIIILATLIPVVLLARLDNIYVILLIVTTLWMGTIGFIDDYIKTFKKNKEGLKGKFKVIGQVGLGIIVGATMFFHPDITIKQEVVNPKNSQELLTQNLPQEFREEEKSQKTTIPFFKDNEFDYADLITWIDPGYAKYAWLIFIPIVIFIVTAVSNGANLTDGIDGLAAGSSAIIVLTLGLFAWVSGNIIFSDYLNVMNIPRTGEMTVFITAFAGALVGFLWYNTFPAQVFMGDTGSLTIGGIIAVLAIATRKELLIPVLCGVFLIENLSVVMQVGWFKYTRKKYGEGRRIFLMSPLHHHYQKKGQHESKIVVRFWIIGILLAVITIVTLKLR
ncbi:phospho-N-acetylmuramoyl-pentapeptide-transferase [Croceibacter atlanticus]|jgi:phospho-N-acetylmuramoyl-pentapeptide-transferase|uniref:Phospho-N-acetylmuramoyl-pentapeptide-transferase n=1 Tax=Croceibacter atlanticus (strain ATCC BAA-628 / JCM 21780 / CIP 108009 / IAM 15332 / KCTC 12090 / HTCC2559) TaxID=216432 RepID=A3U829_CROAH|nr:phospho-N-acetylmuramoyl-pentapeptide-transferase [Croceibacter atlanticus]EAP88396.1 phospho-N-acetylmuramoyl-pentapeptide-transferase [Croceibacter atlanticus HTCC2559]MAM22331.1 phospho-N-acetylmuramoyl-pentapeptide-transferase [Croceibacter sp.]MBW4969470.1 phospho-N-acetylmuramoyl-pentapeptide-transferase [Croceibacter atlanticus]WSP33377.1 phospho-N-acetylmuramoyl-pentapeptide-transferase [Croceibacter atlanticus]|tara:strand:+ start:463446 stop:464678 length:1233 start_codon:yes stop_codon:yes gene_type:complete